VSVKVAIVAAIDAEPSGTMRGRTLLQKKLYFISALTGEDFGYGPHYYGPYSSIVSAEVGALEAASFIVEEVQALGAINAFGEIRRYEYRLLEEANILLTRHEDQTSLYRKVLERINDGNVSSDAKLLSIAAKVHLIMSYGEDSTDGIIEEAKELGWDLSTASVTRVQDYLNRVRALDNILL
jgi:uncharacterized protein